MAAGTRWIESLLYEAGPLEPTQRTRGTGGVGHLGKQPTSGAEPTGRTSPEPIVPPGRGRIQAPLGAGNR